MLDPVMRRLIDPPLSSAGIWLAERRIPANGVTFAGLLIGLAAVPLLASGHYGAALAIVVVNRLFDGLDGAVARSTGVTLFGGYLDIVCDAVFYAAVPFGFALADPANSLWAALLLATFVCTMTSFLGRAIMAGQRSEPDAGQRGRKSFFFSGGLIEGSETILAFALFCLFPHAFPVLAGVFAALCAWTVAARLVEAARTQVPTDRSPG